MPGKRHPPFHKHHRHHPHKFNLTIYELLSKSNYTKNFTALINEDKDLVALLNSTKANYTIFVPTDWAFKKIPKNIHPPKELIKKVLLYHVLSGIYPSFKLLFHHTSPTLLDEPALGNNSQRVLVEWLGPFRGVTVNHRSKVILPNLVCVSFFGNFTNRIRLLRMESSTPPIASFFHLLQHP
jgi:Fasciclin domain